MKLAEETLLQIAATLTRTHGEDIAHEVVLALLRRRNPILKPFHFARRYAAGLARREIRQQWRFKPLSDLPFISKALIDLPNGKFIVSEKPSTIAFGKDRTGERTGRPAWIERDRRPCKKTMTKRRKLEAESVNGPLRDLP